MPLSAYVTVGQKMVKPLKFIEQPEVWELMDLLFRVLVLAFAPSEL